MPYFCVNKCGVSVPIYTDTDGTTKIGNLLPREACGYDNMWGGDGAFCHVYFLSSNGTMRWGFLNYPPFHALAWCTSYPYGTVTLGGKQYYTFKFRKSSTIYDPAANRWGTVAAGKRVATLSATAGQTHLDWKAINYVETASGWQQVKTSNYSYGFVDTGLSQASGADKIAMYGSW